MEALENISTALKGEEIKVVSKQTPKAVQHYLEMFKGMTLADVEEIRLKHENLKAAIYVPNAEDLPEDADELEQVLPEDYNGMLTNSSDEEFFDNRVLKDRFD